jgi:hypothetical protein
MSKVECLADKVGFVEYFIRYILDTRERLAPLPLSIVKELRSFGCPTGSRGDSWSRNYQRVTIDMLEREMCNVQ